MQFRCGVCVCSRCSGCCHGCGSFQNRGSAGAGASSCHFPRERREGNLFGSCLWCRHVGPAGLGDPGCRRAAMEGPEHPSLPAPRPRSQADASGLRPGAVPRAKNTREEAARLAAPPSEPAPEGASPRVPTPSVFSHAARSCPLSRRVPGAAASSRHRAGPGTSVGLLAQPGCCRRPCGQLCSPHSFTWDPWKCLRYFCIYTQQCQLSYLPLFLFPNTGICAGGKTILLEPGLLVANWVFTNSHPLSPPVGACGETQNPLGRAQLCRVCSRGGCSGQAGSSGSSSSDISPL